MKIQPIEPIDIVLVTFNRLNFIKKTVESIYHRTRYPHRVWVVDNCSTDGTQHWLKNAKLTGLIYGYIFLEKNDGLAAGYSEGFKKVTSEYFILSNDDIIPPYLTPCWLERMLHLAKKYPDYAGLAMRIERIRHRNVDESKELIESPTSLASVFRIQKKSDIEIVGGLGRRPHWEGTSFITRTAPLKKKYGVVTHLYASHIGFALENKGFAPGFTQYHTFSQERVNQGQDQPYPDIDPVTNIPLKINIARDLPEQRKRDKYFESHGVDARKSKNLTAEQLEILPYTKDGKGLDLGCGVSKTGENSIGMDIYPFSSVDIIGEVDDLWMFKDNELDFIVNSHLLEHLADPIAALKEWHRTLKPGGKLVVAVPNGEKYPKFILKRGHRSNFGIIQLKLIFKHILKMKIEKAKLISNTKGVDRVILIVGIKV